MKTFNVLFAMELTLRRPNSVQKVVFCQMKWERNVPILSEHKIVPLNNHQAIFLLVYVTITLLNLSSKSVFHSLSFSVCGFVFPWLSLCLQSPMVCLFIFALLICACLICGRVRLFHSPFLFSPCSFSVPTVTSLSNTLLPFTLGFVILVKLLEDVVYLAVYPGVCWVGI